MIRPENTSIILLFYDLSNLGKDQGPVEPPAIASVLCTGRSIEYYTIKSTGVNKPLVNDYESVFKETYEEAYQRVGETQLVQR